MCRTSVGHICMISSLSLLHHYCELQIFVVYCGLLLNVGLIMPGPGNACAIPGCTYNYDQKYAKRKKYEKRTLFGIKVPKFVRGEGKKKDMESLVAELRKLRGDK